MHLKSGFAEHSFIAWTATGLRALTRRRDVIGSCANGGPMSMLRQTSIVGDRDNRRGHASVARRWAKLLLAVVTVALLAGGGTVYFRHVADRAPVATPPPPPVPVIAATVQQRDFPIALAGIGT